ncbi:MULTISPECIES: glycosidase [Deinococcus]|uniref:Glycosidase n=1 Tax=Deinococcus rufus TaxID=2136097 RepID=A0ABV7Z8L1_9DEIO|nr:glycosidase [Deinococcus sp. AB2017081]WQE95663.1 glycosidase [Deinococcus sp. AB2017081]
MTQHVFNPTLTLHVDGSGRFMLRRHPRSPVLRPDPLKAWEAVNVFNAAVVQHGGLFHMHYRAQGVDYVSSIGYAVSEDGLHWNKLERPVLAPQEPYEARGVEDPRVTWHEDDQCFYMAYTAFSAHGIMPCLARSHNLISWERLGPVIRGEHNKDHVVFPRKIGGRYAMFHRRPPHIWIAYSDDLVNWDSHKIVMSPRPQNLGWDEKRIGAGGVPIETPHGWLVLYHAYDDLHVYRLSAALLDLDDPSRVLSRPRTFLMEPTETWEIRGDVPNVCFSCANPVVTNDQGESEVYVYYGGADRMVGLATCRYDDLMAFVQTSPGDPSWDRD